MKKIQFAPKLMKTVVLLSTFCLATTVKTNALAFEITDDAVEDQYIVKPKSSAKCRAVMQNAGEVITEFRSIEAQLRYMDESTRRRIRRKEDECFEYVEPNYKIKLAKVPNDPCFSDEDCSWALKKIQAPAAWDTSTTSEVTIAILDSGVDYTHPDLVANMWKNPREIPNNGKDDDNNGYIDDVYGYDFVNNHGDPFDNEGHGTHCAKIIGAVGNNGIGVVGVNWSVKIMALKITEDNEENGTVANAIKAIEYAILNGVKITNNSWVAPGDSESLYNVIQYYQNEGGLFIAAAGNDSINTDTSPSYPASYDLDNIISVTATNNNDKLAWFSNYGDDTVDLGAPGLSIYTSLPKEDDGVQLGTSMAAPYVTGVVGLLWSFEPSLTYKQVKKMILSSVDPLPSLKMKTVSGGRLNAYNALIQLPPDRLEAHIIASVTQGPAPLTISLDGTTSNGQQIEDYRWKAVKKRTTEIFAAAVDESSYPRGEKAKLVLPLPGTYAIHLTVENNKGETDSEEIEVVVCDPKEDGCNEGTKYIVSFENPGFYIAEFRLDNGGKEGIIGLNVLPTKSFLNSGGFNSGTILKEKGGSSYLAFFLTKHEPVRITPYEYLGRENLLTVQVERQVETAEGFERIRVHAENTLSGKEIITEILEPGFYVISVFSQPDSPRGIAGISIAADSMFAGVNVGGLIDTMGLGFAAFCLDAPQFVEFTLLSGKSFSTAGANGQLNLNICIQATHCNPERMDPNLELHWTNNKGDHYERCLR